MIKRQWFKYLCQEEYWGKEVKNLRSALARKILVFSRFNKNSSAIKRLQWGRSDISGDWRDE